MLCWIMNATSVPVKNVWCLATRLAHVEAELGAARTEVSILVHSLLEGCVDNKFEIPFRPQRPPKADCKGMVDNFDVEVRNKNLDRMCLVDELSGG
jgi:hypothetical protein